MSKFKIAKSTLHQTAENMEYLKSTIDITSTETREVLVYYLGFLSMIQLPISINTIYQLLRVKLQKNENVIKFTYRDIFVIIS